jgi:hypothetical protein
MRSADNGGGGGVPLWSVEGLKLPNLKDYQSYFSLEVMASVDTRRLLISPSLFAKLSDQSESITHYQLCIFLVRCWLNSTFQKQQEML